MPVGVSKVGTGASGAANEAAKAQVANQVTGISTRTESEASGQLT